MPTENIFITWRHKMKTKIRDILKYSFGVFRERSGDILKYSLEILKIFIMLMK